MIRFRDRKYKRTTPTQDVSGESRIYIKKVSRINTLIFKWVQVNDVINKAPNYSWGYGDILRGMVSAYQYSKQHRLNFWVDISQHPLNMILSPTSFYSKRFPYSKVSFIGGDGGDYSTLKVDTSHSNVLFCNVWPNTPLCEDELELLRSFTRVKPDILRWDQPTPKTYRVIHMRTGDTNINSHLDNVAYYMELIESVGKLGDYIITDCNELRSYIYDNHPKYKIVLPGSKIAHSGYTKELESMYLLAAELMLLKGASEVFTFSVYNWVSGFVDWVCKAYSVPLTARVIDTSPAISAGV